MMFAQVAEGKDTDSEIDEKVTKNKETKIKSVDDEEIEKADIVGSDADEDLKTHRTSRSTGDKRRSDARKTKHRKSFIDLFTGTKAEEPAEPTHVPLRPKWAFPIDTELNQILKETERLVKRGKVIESLSKPNDISSKAWININCYVYYNQANDFFGYLRDKCTCDTMTISGKYEYLWADGRTIKKPISIPASDYVDFLMTWIESNFNDHKLFPDYDDAVYRKEFVEVARDIFKRLFRVYGHMYTMHRNIFEEENVFKELETTMKCFIEFIKKYKILDKKVLHPMKKYMDQWKNG